MEKWNGQIERISDDGLGKQEWFFSYHDRETTLKVTNYYSWSRPTKRHGFKAIGSWSRYNQRDNSIQDPPLPDDVADEAKRRYVEMIVVAKD